MKEDNSKNLKDGKRERVLDKVEKHPIIAVILCIVVSINFLQVIYWILTFFGITCFIEPLVESDLLGFFGDFFGSLIGGLIALYVLRVTIVNEWISQRELQRLSLMPMLLYTISDQTHTGGSHSKISMNIIITEVFYDN